MNKSTGIIKLLILIPIITVLLGMNLIVLADVSIKPYDFDPLNPNDNGWVTRKVNKGDTVDDALRISNDTKTAKNVIVYPKDFQLSQEGRFDLISDNQQNKSTGSWINIGPNNLSIPAKSEGVRIPFQVKVPENIESGEYAAGVAMIETNKEDKDKAVVVQTRKAVRTYFTVRGDLSLSAEVNDLNIIYPKTPEFEREKQVKSYIGRDNLVFKFKAKNTGNIFGLLEGHYTITYSDGQKIEGRFNQELAPKIESQSYYITTNQPFKEGENRIDLSYTFRPLNKVENLENLKTQNLEGTLTNSVTLNKEELENFKPALNKNSQTSSSVSTLNNLKNGLSTKSYEEWIANLKIIFYCILLFSVLYYCLRQSRPDQVKSFESKLKKAIRSSSARLRNKKDSKDNTIDKEMYF